MTNSAAKWAPLFPEVEIDFILDAVLRCGNRLKKMHTMEPETHVSKRLCAYLFQDAKLRERPIEVSWEPYAWNHKGKVVGRIDIWFKYSTGSWKPWPYFALEAKRLHVTFPSGWRPLIGGYVTGNQGMRCFTEERYARELQFGGMLGYVYDGKVDAAREGVATAIKRASTKLKCDPVFRSASRCGSVIGTTAHRVGRGEFIIYHLFIAV